MKLEIALLPPSLNVYLRMHRWAKARLRKDFTWALRVAMFDELRQSWAYPFPPKRGARITVFRGKGAKVLDDDNLVGGMKPLIDAMRDVDLIRDDSPKWFKLVAEQKRDRANPRVEIELEDIP